jgi:hypothetical protein
MLHLTHYQLDCNLLPRSVMPRHMLDNRAHRAARRPYLQGCSTRCCIRMCTTIGCASLSFPTFVASSKRPTPLRRVFGTPQGRCDPFSKIFQTFLSLMKINTKVWLPSLLSSRVCVCVCAVARAPPNHMHHLHFAMMAEIKYGTYSALLFCTP